MSRISTWILGFFITTMVPALLHAEILELPSMTQLEQYVDEDTLVLFDLDHTLFEVTTAWGHIAMFHHEIEAGKKAGIDPMTTISRIYPPWVESQEVCSIRPVEAIIPSLIRKLQDRKIKTMGLTHRQIVVSLHALDQLASIDIDFERNTLYDRQLDISGFVAPARFLEGVLFVADYNEKGQVLKAFLDKVGYCPKKVVFVDDGMRNLISVEKALSPLGIPFIGLHYRWLEHAHESWDPEVAELQENTFGTILSDQAARCLLEHGTNAPQNQ